MAFALIAAMLLPALTGAARAESDCGEVRLPIIMYHSVSAGAVGDYIVSPETLRADVDYLVRAGYNTVLPEEVIAFVRRGEPLPPRPIMLTFDDGCYNFLSAALPILEEYNVKAAVCVVGSFAARERGAAMRSGRFSYLSPEEIARLAENGRVSVQNHSFRLHSGMGALPFRWEKYDRYRERFLTDLMECDRLLRDCGARPTLFACPFGRYRDYTIRALKEAGYLAMLTCEERVNVLKKGDTGALYRLGRFNRSERRNREKFFGAFAA